mgnify:CR=1 FL=1
MKILLVSGFLGAGKTTFIKEMAKNINLEFVVLENEYADIGVDGDFLDEKNLNVWEMSEDIPGIYQAEKALFVTYLHESNKQTCLAFAPMVLWGFAQKKLDFSPIPETLYQQMIQDEFPDLIEALWQEHGTLTKAATRLFIHRNTLQYRIDRFGQLTGLSLKNMDALTLCHFLLMQQEY